ncbi:GNAT family N-acetyltransferase [Solimonas fluminis]|uniref:GNAT family N-acetyltransferase n=1 Tax=Solimonas fluminis TaxID=2086571 RepID=UPI001FAEB34D|nr:GNAT family N-acetyltransferase [Solimonas fluminis]
MLIDSFTSPPLPTAFKYLLDDGTPALIRPVYPEDLPRLRAGMESLLRLPHRRRTVAGFEQLSDEEFGQLMLPDQKTQVIWGALNLDKPEEPGIGVARFAVIPGEPAAADVAIAIGEPYRRQGAGQVLHACLHLTARLYGIKRFYYDVHADNQRFIRLLHALGARQEGSAHHIERLSLPVYQRAVSVPSANPLGMRFADVFRRLHRAEPMPVEDFVLPLAGQKA